MALEEFKRAIQIHLSLDNMEGIAQVNGNMGQLHIKQGNLEAAITCIEDAYALVKTRFSEKPSERLEIAMQYAVMNLGLLRKEQKMPFEAIGYFSYVLQRFRLIVSYVQRVCAQELVDLYSSPEIQNTEYADAIKAISTPLFQVKQKAPSAKDLSFVLDTSGSMYGSRIEACRRSIVSILQNQLNHGDHVSLTAFHTVSYEVFPLVDPEKYGLERMIKDVNERTNQSGGTAFWATLAEVCPKMEATKSWRDQFVVALTDGEDYSSNPAESKKVLQNLFANGSSICLIVITVGTLNNRGEIKEMVQLSRN
ncbi:hypothetical protein HK096_000729, partial [Nowakowskiella sp. JEL0078]